MVSGAQQSVAGKLERAGLIVATRTEAGGITKGTPAFYYTLTQSGQEMAERFSEQLIRCPEVTDRYKVNQQQIRHSLVAQVATAKAIIAGTAIKYETERMFDADGDQASVKRPDVVWTLPSEARIAVEVELSAKWDRRLDEFVHGIAVGLAGNEDRTARFDRFMIVTDSPAIIRRYSDAIQPGRDIQIWTKNARQQWCVDHIVPVPKWLIERVDFHLIG
jgi:hypothetical protein